MDALDFCHISHVRGFLSVIMLNIIVVVSIIILTGLVLVLKGETTGWDGIA